MDDGLGMVKRSLLTIIVVRALRPHDEVSAVETKTITLQVDGDLAKAYQAASAQDRSKLELLLNLWLRELFARSISLKALMDELSEKARARGLTAEKLEAIGPG